MARFRVGIDVGGTFTDAVMINEQNGEIKSTKVLTTTEDQSQGVLAALKELRISPQDISLLVHGFTVGINAVLTRSGEKTGLLTTWGHRDLLDIQRNNRGFEPRGIYNPRFKRTHQERPLVERRYRRQIQERILYDGSERWAIDENQVRREIEFLKKEGIKSIAVCFINAYASQSHEQRVKDIIQQVFPTAYVSTSSINPVAKEYERTCTVVLDAYIGRQVNAYLDNLDALLKKAGYEGEILIMQLSGGARTLEKSKQNPINTINSGPVGGTLGTQTYSRWTNSPNLLMMDTGGTTTDFSIVRGHDLMLTNIKEVELRVPLMLPMIDITSIGAGGGSLIYRDTAGVLRVGPQSAGARPGPACYNLGGTEPTLSDAYVIMGLLQPDYFLGGRMRLYPELAEKTLAPIATSMGLALQEAAQTAFELYTVHTSEVIRRITAYKGIDTRDFALMAFGSAGPMHACYTIRDLAMQEAIIPLHPGGFSAFGMISTDMRADNSEGLMRRLDTFTPEEFDDHFKALEAISGEDLKKQGFDPEEVTLERVYYGMYLGQTWEVLTRIPLGPYDAKTMKEINSNFHKQHKQKYGYEAPEIPIMVASIQSTAIGKIHMPDISQIKEGDTQPPPDALLTKRDVFLDRRVNNDVPFYSRAKLLANNKIKGPAVVVEDLATTVVGNGFTLLVDDMGSLRIKY